MLILLSPSKSQDFTKENKYNLGQIGDFIGETKKLSNVIKKYSSANIRNLMNISPKLSDLNYKRFQDWNSSFSKNSKNKEGEYNFLPSLLAFTGDVYLGFNLDDYKRSDWVFADESIRIISGFYGILKPTDYLKPYRLEMGVKMKFKVGSREYKNLYEFWKEALTFKINSDLKRGDFVLNLASVEYSSVIDKIKVKGDWVDIFFKINKGGKIKIIAIYAKKARGEMANWVILNKIKDKKDLKKFSENGWKFSKKESMKDSLVFIKIL